MPFVDDGLGGGQTKPRGRVAESEYPDAHYNLLGTFDGADALSLHRVTDCDVALNRERSQTQG